MKSRSWTGAGEAVGVVVAAGDPIVDVAEQPPTVRATSRPARNREVAREPVPRAGAQDQIERVAIWRPIPSRRPSLNVGTALDPRSRQTQPRMEASYTACYLGLKST